MWNKSQVCKYNALVRLLVMLGPAGGGVGGLLSIHTTLQIAVADPNLQMGGRGGGSHLECEIRGRVVSKKIFLALWGLSLPVVLK